MRRRYQELITRIRKKILSAPGSQDRPWVPAEAPLKGAASERSPARYDAVIDQFVVEKNPRYRRDQQGKGETYCNIFVWDVTRAMSAEIPHWVDQENNPAVLGKGIELDANAVIQWLQNRGQNHGWKRVDPQQAQELANQGFPVVVTWLNPGGIGHIAVVRPGQYSPNQGPRIAQAGGKNFNHGTVAQGFQRLTSSQDVVYYYHE
ncbi:hypothetical protein ACFLY4_02390 [Chloroflexota bacterium]